MDVTSISLCMIVRDEEEHLAKCLNSVKDVADEIIVVDTGSRDKSAAIAESFGALIFFHQWNDSFSIPRNISLDHASGDWILVLDADEVLAPQSKNQIKAAVQRDEIRGYEVLIQLSPKWTAMRSLRLFKRSPEVRYEGIFHEKLTVPNRDLCAYVPSEITIIHKPWCKQDIDKKRARNINLLNRHIDLYPHDLYQIFDLIRLNLETGGGTDEAEKLLDKASVLLISIESHDRNYKLYHGSYYLYKLILCSKQKINLKDMLPLCEQAVSALPGCPLFLYETAKICFKLAEYDKAADYFQQCIDLGTSEKFDRSLIFPKEILGALSTAGLGHCFFKKRDYQKAEHYFNEAYVLKKDEKVKMMISACRHLKEGSHPPSRFS